MRPFLLLALLIILIPSCKPDKENKPDPIPNNKALAWSKTLGGSNKDYGNSIVQLSSGEYVMAGSTRSYDGDLSGSRSVFDTWLTKLDINGNKMWSMNYGTQDDKYTTGLAATSDGGFIITGYSGYLLTYNGVLRDSTPNYALIIKTDASGNKQWQKVLAVDSKALNVFSSEGNNVIVGYKLSASGGYDGWVMKVDNNGNELWNKTFGGVNEDQLHTVIKSADGGYILGGYTQSGDVVQNRGDFDGWIIKLDANGTQLWTRTYGGSGRDIFKSIIFTPDGNYVAVGHSDSNDGDIQVKRGGFDEWILKLDGAGNKIWSKTYGGKLNEITTGVVNTTDGGYLVSGFTNSIDFDVTRPSTDWGAWLVKVDANGNKTVSSAYGDQYDNVADKMIATSDGGYLFTGHTDKRTPAGIINYDAWIVKVDSL